MYALRWGSSVLQVSKRIRAEDGSRPFLKAADSFAFSFALSQSRRCSVALKWVR